MSENFDLNQNKSNIFWANPFLLYAAKLENARYIHTKQINNVRDAC